MALKLGTQTGSLFNHLDSRVAYPTPAIGDPATILMWTDRKPGTVVHVNKSGKTIQVQEDRATRTDTNGMSEMQEYDYTRDPEGTIYTFRLYKKGWKEVGGGCGVRLGRREKYHDFSF